jgi:hypothetical protein
MLTLKSKKERSIVIHVLFGSIMRHFFHLVICSDDRILREKKLNNPLLNIRMTRLFVSMWKNLADYRLLSEIVIFVKQKDSSSFIVISLSTLRYDVYDGDIFYHVKIDSSIKQRGEEGESPYRIK